MTKKCTKCLKELDISCFSKKSSSKDGLRTYCKICGVAYTKEYKSLHRLKVDAKVREYQKSHPEKYQKYAADYRERNREKINKNHKIRRETQGYKLKQKQWYLKNREKILHNRKQPDVRQKIRAREKIWRSDPMRRVSGAVSRYLRFCLGKNKNGMHWEDLVGFTLEELKQYLESKFLSGMTWENYGEWEIDHIRPVSSFTFDSTEHDDFKLCWSLNNLQPLWKTDNRHKHASFGR